MSFQGYVAHFGLVIWEKIDSRPRRGTKQAKQAKHIFQMGRRHRNHPLGAGACLWRCFLNQLIDVSIFETNWLVVPVQRNWFSSYNLLKRYTLGVKNSFLGGDGGLIWDSDQTCRYNKMWPKIFWSQHTRLRVSKKIFHTFIFSCKKWPIEVFVEYVCLRDSSVGGWLSQCLMNTNMCNRNMLGGCYYVLRQTSTSIHSTN